jgi:hypothetical protein
MGDTPPEREELHNVPHIRVLHDPEETLKR